MMDNETRWKQRFQNFEKAYEIFSRRISEHAENTGKEVYQMALVQGFEIVIELAWKTMKDYLENEGYEEVKNSKHAIRTAFHDGLIKHPEAWMKAVAIRNFTSHVYDSAILQKNLQFIQEEFYPILRELYVTLKGKQ